MSIAEQVEMQKLIQRVAELEVQVSDMRRDLSILTSAWPVGDKRDTLHLRDKKRG